MKQGEHRGESLSQVGAWLVGAAVEPRRWMDTNIWDRNHMIIHNAGGRGLSASTMHHNTIGWERGGVAGV